MRRKFTEDGWRFSVTVHERVNAERRVVVQFYDDSLVHPEVEDIYRVEDVRQGQGFEETEYTPFGFTLWTSKRPVTDEEYLPPIEEHVGEVIDEAWDRIEEIGENPSDQLRNAIRSRRA